jgi:hypothetical protein
MDSDIDIAEKIVIEWYSNNLVKKFNIAWTQDGSTA